MSYGLYDQRHRYRRRFWARLGKAALWVILIGGVAGFSYLVGVEQLRSREGSMQEELATQIAARDQAERRAAQLQQIAQTQEVRANELEIRLKREVPGGDLAKLSDLISRKLSEGVSPERVAFVLEQMSNPRDCTKRETKRFVLPTPLYRGANTSVAFADGAITISGEGVPARNENGSPEAWFDPGKPVTLRISQGENPPQEVSGLLPLQHSVLAAGREVQFTIAAGARSFVEITGELCSFP